MCRLLFAEKNIPAAREYLTQACQLVEETGYHRRDSEVRELEDTLAQPSS